MRQPQPRRGGRWRRAVSLGLATGLAASALAACGGSGGTTLTWYINPDSGGQDAVAKNCSTKDYTSTTSKQVSHQAK